MSVLLFPVTLFGSVLSLRHLLSSAIIFLSRSLLYSCATCIVNNLSLHAKVPLLKLCGIIKTLSAGVHCNNRLGIIFNVPLTYPRFFVAFLSHIHNSMQNRVLSQGC